MLGRHIGSGVRGDRGVHSFWRTSEIRAGIILEAAYQSQVGSHTYTALDCCCSCWVCRGSVVSCLLCWKLSVIALVRRGRYRTMVPVLVEFHSVHVLFDVVGSYRMDSL